MRETVKIRRLTGEAIAQLAQQRYRGVIYATGSAAVKPLHSNHEPHLVETKAGGRERRSRDVDVIYFEDGEETIVNATITTTLIAALGPYDRDWVGAEIEIGATQVMVTVVDKTTGEEQTDVQWWRTHCRVLRAPGGAHDDNRY